MGSDQHQVDDRIEPLERLQPPYRGGKLGACRRGQKTPGERVELGVQRVVGAQSSGSATAPAWADLYVSTLRLLGGRPASFLRSSSAVSIGNWHESRTGCLLMFVWLSPSGAASLPAGSLNSPGLPSVCFQIPNVPSYAL